jgi:hypothetical protein
MMGPSATRVARLFRQARAQCFYDGPPLEEGGTSITGKAAPFIRRLGKIVTPGMKILDYGAGRVARNADHLRTLGAKVYAYDPFHSTGGDGWEPGSVTQRLPHGKFDLVFTCYVLNVVPKHIEDNILKNCRRFAKGTEYHVTRNKDILVMVRRALGRDDARVGGFVREWFVTRCRTDLADVPFADWTDDDYMDLCHYGVATSAGFQRIPILENQGYTFAAKTSGWKAYKRG